jgi:hypothetical protein
MDGISVSQAKPEDVGVDGAAMTNSFSEETFWPTQPLEGKSTTAVCGLHRVKSLTESEAGRGLPWKTPPNDQCNVIFAALLLHLGWLAICDCPHTAMTIERILFRWRMSPHRLEPARNTEWQCLHLFGTTIQPLYFVAHQDVCIVKNHPMVFIHMQWRHLSYP